MTERIDPRTRKTIEKIEEIFDTKGKRIEEFCNRRELCLDFDILLNDNRHISIRLSSFRLGGRIKLKKSLKIRSP